MCGSGYGRPNTLRCAHTKRKMLNAPLPYQTEYGAKTKRRERKNIVQNFVHLPHCADGTRKKPKRSIGGVTINRCTIHSLALSFLRHSLAQQGNSMTSTLCSREDSTHGEQWLAWIRLFAAQNYDATSDQS